MRITPLLLILLLACQKKEVDFDSLYSISSRLDQKSSSLLVDISLDKSIHAYALGEKIGIPLSLEVSPKNGWLADGKASLPLGKKKDLGVVLEGKVHVEQKVKKGHGPGEAFLHLQVCSKNACDRPRIHTLIFE